MKTGVNPGGQMSAAARQFMFGRNPRPESAPIGQFPRAMQQQQQPQQPQHHFINQQQQFQQYGQQQQQQYNGPAQQMGGGGVNPAHYSPSPMNGYGNNMAAVAGRLTSPAMAATAPQHFGPSFCQIPQAQQQQQQQQPQSQQMYNNNNNNNSTTVGNNMTTPQSYLSPSSANYPVQQTVNVANQQHMQQQHQVNYNPNGFNQQVVIAQPASNAPVPVPCNPASPMINNGQQQQGYGGHQCAGIQSYSNPCSPCTGHHHHHVAPVCNNNPAAVGNNWQCYPTAVANQQQQQMSPFQQQQNGTWMNNAMPPHGQMNGQQQQQQQQQTAMMYPIQMQQHQTNGPEAMNNYQAAVNNYQPCPPPPYNATTNNNAVVTAIQCQDVSQSQDFNRTRAQEAVSAAAATPQTPCAAPSIQSQIGSGATAGASPATPITNMRPETYQRTLEYVQQCQTQWATGDNAKAAKENKPPQATPQSASAGVKMTTTETTTVVGRALLSPGQDAVSSSTDRQEAAAAAAAALLPSASNHQSVSNMVVHDMNTSLNSLMQENRFLQMIQ